MSVCLNWIWSWADLRLLGLSFSLLESSNCRSKELKALWNILHIEGWARFWVKVRARAWSDSVVFIFFIKVFIHWKVALTLTLSMRLWWKTSLFVPGRHSGHFWNEHTAWLILVDGEYVNLLWIVVAWTWNFSLLCFSRDWLSRLLGNFPSRTFFWRNKCLLNFIVAWTWNVSLNSCISFFSVLLSDKLSIIVLFITEYIVMRGNWRRIRLFVPLNLLPFWLWRRLFAIGPFLSLNVLAWARSDRFLFELFVVKSFDLRSKCILRLNDCYAKLFETIHRQIFGRLHALADLIKARSSLISSRT